MVSEDTKTILNGVGWGASVGVVGFLVSGASSGLGGPQLGYKKLSLKSGVGAAVSGAIAFFLVGLTTNTLKKKSDK